MYFIIITDFSTVHLGLNYQKDKFKVYTIYSRLPKIRVDDKLLVVQIPLEEFVEAFYTENYLIIDKIIIPELISYPLNMYDTYKKFTLTLPSLENCVLLNNREMLMDKLTESIPIDEITNAIDLIVKINAALLKLIIKEYQLPERFYEQIREIAISKYNSVDSIKILVESDYYKGRIGILLDDYRKSKGEIKNYIIKIFEQIEDEYTRALIDIINKDNKN